MTTTDQTNRPRLERIVTEDAVARALDYLIESAAEAGRIREEAIKADRYVDHLEAILIRASDETSDAKRKAEARASKEWKDANDKAAWWAGELEKIRALRDAANARIEAWRSESANYRGLKV